MSYKQFIQELEDDILPAEAERRYKVLAIVAFEVERLLLAHEVKILKVTGF